MPSSPSYRRMRLYANPSEAGGAPAQRYYYGEAPEMVAAPGFAMEGADLEAEAAWLAPEASGRLGGRGKMAMAAGLALLLGATALHLFQLPPQMGAASHKKMPEVSKAIGQEMPESGSCTLQEYAHAGKVYLRCSELTGDVEAGMMIVIDKGHETEEEVSLVSKVYQETKAIILEHPLAKSHWEGTRAIATPHTQELQNEHEKLKGSHTHRLQVDLTGQSVPRDSVSLDLSGNCYQFQPGDNIEIADRSAGYHETNMVTGITFNDEAHTSCNLELQDPVEVDHPSGVVVTKMVHTDPLAPAGPEPTDAPVPVPPPTSAPAVVGKHKLGEFDTDKDGVLCRTEAYLSPEVAARFPDLDSNRDGVLNLGAESDAYVSLDADGDGFITRAEAAGDAFVSGKFDAWDMDKDGRLSQNELLWAALDRDGDNEVTKVDALSYPQVAVAFDDMDKNHDGLLSFEEFSSFKDGDSNTDGVLTREEAVGAGAGDAHDHVREERFDIVDKNGDGRVEEHEMIHDILDNPAFDRGTPPMYQDLDKDGDGHISESEAKQDGTLAAHFELLDKDGDKKLSHSELLSVLDTNGDGEISLAESMGHPELAARFKEYDTGNKGHVTLSDLGSFNSVDLGDGYISEEEALANAYLNDNFDVIDVDGDGRLSPFELKLHALDANNDGAINTEEAMAYPELAARFPDFDRDGDNFLTVQELGAFRSLDSNGNGRVSHAEASKDQHVREHFRKWDANSVNRLSDSDFRLAALGMPDVDTDGDGEISEDELNAADAGKCGYLKAHFSDIDKDGDKKLSKQELLFWSLDTDRDDEVTEGEVLVSHPELASLFMVRDGNKDGKLTWNEFKHHHPVDSNNDGVITQDEVDAYPDQSVKDELGKMDHDGDGKIEKHEMVHHALDENGDGKVDKSEARADPAVLTHFDQHDDDNDGLDPQELRDALLAQDLDGSGLVSKVEAFAADPEVAARFPELDKDKDGFLTANEMEGYDSLDRAHDGSVSRAEADGDAYVKSKFDAWDLNKDGALSTSELMVAALDTDKDKKVSKAEAMALSWELGARFSDFQESDGSLKLSNTKFENYRSLDHNLDGYITKAEAADDAFVSDMFDTWDIFVKDGRLQQQELLAAALRKDLSKLDQFKIQGGKMVKDKDGKVSKHEARTGDAEVSMRFAALDTDQDGYLSPDEYKDYSTLDQNFDGYITRSEANHDAFNTYSPAKYVSDRFDGLDNNPKDDRLSQQEMLGQADWTFTMEGIHYDQLAADSATFEKAKSETSKTVAGKLGVDENQVTTFLKPGSVNINIWLDAGMDQLGARKGDIKKAICILWWVSSSLGKIGDAYSTGSPGSDCPSLSAMKGDLQVGTASTHDASMSTASADDAGVANGRFLGLRGQEWLQLLLLLLAAANFVFFWFIVKSPPTYRMDHTLFAEEKPATVPIVPTAPASSAPAIADLITPDAIIVLGSGLQKDGRLQPWVQQRLARAKAIYDKAIQQRGSPPVIVTMNEGIRNTMRDPRGPAGAGGAAEEGGEQQADLESQLAKRFLEGLPGGIPASDVISDNHSLDLVGSAYFPRTSTTFKEAAPDASNLCVVTNRFHMDRAKEVFKRIVELPVSQDDGPVWQPFNLMFEEVGDERVAAESLASRAQWERQMLAEFQATSKDWKDLRDVYSYIFPSAETGRLPKSLTQEDLAGDPYREQTPAVNC